MGSVPRQLDPGRLTRAAIHCDAGEVELRLSTAGNWQLAIRRSEEREWQLACSGDLDVGTFSEAARAERDPLHLGKLLIDSEARRVFVEGREVRLSNLEYRLLAMLATQPYRVFTKEELMQSVWGYDGIVTRTLDSHASRIRVKLRRVGADGYVLNCQRIGYKLCDAKQIDRFAREGRR